MAGVARTGSLVEQILLVAGLRWQVFRNSLRTTSGRFDLLAQILVGLMGSVFVLGGSLGLGAVSYAAVAQGRFPLLALAFWGVLLFWQLMPLLLTVGGREFDLRTLLRFPLRYSAFWVLHLAYGLSDPPAVASLLWLAAMGIGITLARAELLPQVAIVLVLFAGVNLLLSRAVLSWLDRLLARRRSREAAVAVIVLLLLSVQLFGALGSRWEKRVKPYAEAVLPVLAVLPPGQAERGVASAATGHAGTFAGGLAWLAGYGILFGALLHRRLRAQYRGEDLSESRAPTRVAPVAAAPAVAPAGPVSLAWRWSPLPEPAAAILQKEFQYLVRNTSMLLLLVLPPILITFIGLTLSAPRRGSAGPAIVSRAPDLAFPMAVAYMFLIVSQVAFNSFAYESRGVQLYFVTPVRLRNVLLAKNLLLGCVLALESVVVWAVVSVLVRPPSAGSVMATYAWLLFATVVEAIVGNWTSLQFPRRFEFGTMRRRASGVTALVAVVLTAVLLGLAAGVSAVTRLLGQAWMTPMVFLLLSAIALAGYVASLDRFERFGVQRREALLEQLCR